MSDSYYMRNRAKKLEYQKQYYDQHREERIEYQKAYNERNKEKNIAYLNEYREKIKNKNINNSLTLNSTNIVENIVANSVINEDSDYEEL